MLRLRASRGLLEGDVMATDLPRCNRCGGRMFLDWPYGREHGYGWEAHCYMCGNVRYAPRPPAPPRRTELAVIAPARTRNTAPCLPDHAAALRQWLTEHGAHEGINVSMATLAAELECRNDKHLRVALWQLSDAGVAEVRFSPLRAVRGEGGWRVKLKGAAVT